MTVFARGSFTADGAGSGAWSTEGGIKGHYDTVSANVNADGSITFVQRIIQDNGSVFGLNYGTLLASSVETSKGAYTGTWQVDDNNGRLLFKNYRNGSLIGEGSFASQTFGYIGSNFADTIKGTWKTTSEGRGNWQILNTSILGFYKPGFSEYTTDLYIDSNNNSKLDSQDKQVGMAVASIGTYDLTGTWSYSPTANLGDYFNAKGEDAGLVVLTDTSFLPSSYKTVNAYALSGIKSTTQSVNKSLTGNSYDYRFLNIGYGRYGLQQKGASSIDEITGASNIQFQDQTVSVPNDVAATFNQVKGKDDVSGVVFRLYNAAFSRLPDANGLQNWINGNASGNVTYASSAQSFSESQEFKNRYGSNVTDTQFITTLYNNVLGRAPDATGLSHYQSLLAGGRSRGALLLDFSESPENRVLFTQVTGLA